MREAMPEPVNDTSASEPVSTSVCRVCKKEMSSTEDVELNLHFVDTTGIYHSHNGFNNSVHEDLTNSSLLDLMNEKTPGGTSVGMANLQQNNPKAFKMYKQRTLEVQQMKERVSKVEKLLAENLENMDIAQRQSEQQIAALTKSNKDKQTALEASEKNRARDKMIIKFREERIAELESRLASAEENASSPNGDPCSKCDFL